MPASLGTSAAEGAFVKTSIGRRATTRDDAERVFCATVLSLVVSDFAFVSSAPTGEFPAVTFYLNKTIISISQNGHR